MLRTPYMGLAGAVSLLLVLWFPAASPAAVTCTYSETEHVLTVAVKRSFPRITRSGDAIAVTDDSRPVICAGGPPTVSNTDLVRVMQPGFDGTDIDLAGGPFAPGATLEGEGGSEIEFEVVGKRGILDVNGTPAGDVLAWGPDGLNLNFDLNGDRDVDVTATSFLTRMFAHGGRGPDLIAAQADYSGGTVHSNGGPGNDVLIAPSIGGILLGGSGSDTIRGGRFDFINGGRGRDRIRAGPGGDLINVVDGTKDRVSCGGGRDKGRADPVDKLKGCERVNRVGKGRASSSRWQETSQAHRLSRVRASLRSR